MKGYIKARVLAALGVMFTVFSPPLSAQTPSTLVMAPLTKAGKTASVVLREDQVQVKQVVFWLAVTGNSSEGLEMYLEAPDGATASLRAVAQGKKTSAELLTTNAAWYSLPFITENGKERLSLPFEKKNPLLSAHSPTVSAALINCTGFDQSTIETLLKFYSASKGRPITQEELCGTTTPTPGDGNSDDDDTDEPTSDPTDGGTIPDYNGYPTSTLGANNVAKVIRALFSKDTCQSKPKATYLLALQFDLSTLNPALYKSGLTVAANIYRRQYKGETSASIKPVSDGKYAPHPIVLMSTLDSYYGTEKEKIRLVRWNRGKIKSMTALPIVKYAPHFGNIYAVALVSKVLKGGKGVFEMTDGADIYSACFALERRRQKVNGYR